GATRLPDPKHLAVRRKFSCKTIIPAKTHQVCITEVGITRKITGHEHVARRVQRDGLTDVHVGSAKAHSPYRPARNIEPRHESVGKTSAYQRCRTGELRNSRAVPGDKTDSGTIHNECHRCVVLLPANAGCPAVAGKLRACGMDNLEGNDDHSQPQADESTRHTYRGITCHPAARIRNCNHEFQPATQIAFLSPN